MEKDFQVTYWERDADGHPTGAAIEIQWFQAYVDMGYGIDDPRNDDLGVLRQDPFDPTSSPIAGQRSRNAVGWANLIWDVSEQFDVAFEVSHRETDYIAPSISNDAMVYHFRSRLKF